MSAMLQCLSHSPLKGYVDPPDATVRAVAREIEKLSQEISAFDPEIIFLFGPDHYNGFFLDVMPQLCIGINANSVGDYKTSKGPLNVPQELAEQCAAFVVNQDIDLAVSYRMQIDHGVAQPLEELTGSLSRYPVIPLFINSVAPPLISFRRARQFGEAVGKFARRLDRRVLFIGSGGLSHNPPVPQMAGATPEIAEFLIAGRNPTPEGRAARQQRTRDAATLFATGDSPLHPLNATWDETFISHLVNQNWPAIDAYENHAVSAEAGRSTHEVKTWVAANAAMHAATQGKYKAEKRYYQPIPEWIAGFGIMAGHAQR